MIRRSEWAWRAVTDLLAWVVKWEGSIQTNPEGPMKSLVDGLPPEIASQVHPDWRKNEQEYWAAREGLLPQYRGQWVAFADGAVVASGTSPVEVFHAAAQSGRHPFVICVGREEEPTRMRRLSFRAARRRAGDGHH